MTIMKQTLSISAGLFALAALTHPAFAQTVFPTGTTIYDPAEAYGSTVGAVPEDGLEHRADPKARSARQLIEHLIGHNLDLQELLDDGVIHHRNQVPFDSVETAVQQVDEREAWWARRRSGSLTSGSCHVRRRFRLPGENHRASLSSHHGPQYILPRPSIG